MPSKYAVASGVLFGVVAVLQAVRALYQWPVHIGSVEIPVWGSWLQWSLLVACASGHFSPDASSTAMGSLFVAVPPNNTFENGRS